MIRTEQQTRKADLLRRLHQAPPVLLLPNAWDAASARVFESAGAKAIATTSAGIAFALGYADGQNIPRGQMLEVVARIAANVSVPVTADVEAGYGDSAADAAETARLVIEAGAVGMNFEDARTDVPRTLFELNQQVARVRAIREAAAKAGVPLVLNARTDVYLAEIGEPAGRFDEAVRRLNAYRDAGADCLFVPGVTDRAVIEKLALAVSGPLNVLVGAGTPSVRDLEQIGVARLSVGSGIMRATLATARDAARALLEKGSYSAILEKTIPFREIDNLMARKISS